MDSDKLANYLVAGGLGFLWGKYYDDNIQKVIGFHEERIVTLAGTRYDEIPVPWYYWWLYWFLAVFSFFITFKLLLRLGFFKDKK